MDQVYLTFSYLWKTWTARSPKPYHTSNQIHPKPLLSAVAQLTSVSPHGCQRWQDNGMGEVRKTSTKEHSHL